MKYIKPLKPILVLLLTTLLVLSFITSITISIWGEDKVSPILTSCLSTTITCMILIPIFLKQYTKLVKDKFSFKLDGLKFFISGVMLSLVINIGYLLIYKLFNINIVVENDYILLSLIVTGILSPILEEVMFRGIIFNNYKKIFDFKKALILSIVAFCLVHIGILNIITALTIGVITTYIYIKEKSIIKPIIFHIGFNVLVFVYRLFVINLDMIYILIILGLGLCYIGIVGYQYIGKKLGK